jgi:hypothetical protein
MVLDPTIYDDPTNAMTEQQAQGVVGDEWHVTVS